MEIKCEKCNKLFIGSRPESWYKRGRIIENNNTIERDGFLCGASHKGLNEKEMSEWVFEIELK